MKKKKVENKKVINIILIFMILVVFLSIFFSKQLSILLYIKPNYEYSESLEFHFIDVGQGEAIFVKFDNGETMLYDTGLSSYRGKLSSYLKNIGLGKNKTIDYLVLSHTDTDHSGNLNYILNNYNVRTFYRPYTKANCEDITSETNDEYNKAISYCYSHNIDMVINQQGLNLIVGCTMVRWLCPIDGIDLTSVEDNNLSPVIRFDYFSHSVLLTGDIDSNVENDLISKYSSDMLDVDVLNFAHHGSKYSTSEEFLMTTTPKYAVICVGENSYGHPANETIQRVLQYDYNTNGSLYNNMYDTRNNGNIILSLNDQIKVTTFANINDYSFIPYFVYAGTIIMILVVILLIPYYEVWKTNREFDKRNREFEQLKKSI